MSALYVVSDLHIAPHGPLSNFFAGDPLTRFVRSLPTKNVELVLLGDTLDLLVSEGRPPHLDLLHAKALVEEHLAQVALESWGPALLESLGTFVRAGGQLTIIPGNHDPELFHPDCEEVLQRALGLSENAPLLDRSGLPLERRIGTWSVTLGHGHRGDPMNEIDPTQVHEALRLGPLTVPLPAGSLLVMRTLNAFKRATHADGSPRFGFIDRLKPEMPWVLLLLLYLDPLRTLDNAPLAAASLIPGLLAHVRQAVRRGAILGAGNEQHPALDPLEQIVRDVSLGLSDDDLNEMTPILLDTWLRRGPTDVDVGDSLAPHGGALRMLLRAAMRSLERDAGFFELHRAGRSDQALLDDVLSKKHGPSVLIAGHTHAAKELQLDVDRVYLNTGTWTDLLPLPNASDDDALTAWIDALTEDRLPRLRRFSYAEVTEAGPRLLEWTDP